MPETKQVIYILVGLCHRPNEFNQAEEILASQSRYADACRIMCEEIQDVRFWKRFRQVEIRRQEVIARRTSPFGSKASALSMSPVTVNEYSV
jgi:hypothetical protein